jgi:hypothetical protein
LKVKIRINRSYKITEILKVSDNSRIEYQEELILDILIYILIDMYKYLILPVTTQIRRTDMTAPRTSALLPGGGAFSTPATYRKKVQDTRI